MRDHYDFSKMKGRKNPYIKHLKQPVTMRLDRDTVSYFLFQVHGGGNRHSLSEPDQSLSSRLRGSSPKTTHEVAS